MLLTQSFTIILFTQIYSPGPIKIMGEGDADEVDVCLGRWKFGALRKNIWTSSCASKPSK